MFRSQRLLASAAVVLAGVGLVGLSQTGERSAAAAAEPSGYQHRAYVALDQGWTEEEVGWWYFLSQGTLFMPYEWLISLEKSVGQELFASAANLSRLGFLVDPADEALNPDGLPVGFARRTYTGAEGAECWSGNWVGFACAACHTGQVDFRGHRIRIEGGAARHDIELFQEQLGSALNATLSDPLKFRRFAERVMATGAETTPQDLRQRFQCFAEDRAAALGFFGLAQSQAAELPTASGFGRLDAHERGVNLLLAEPIREVRNYVPETAPVSFPQTWDTPFFAYVLYNSSIRQPLTRNVIEALGVQAPVNHATLLTDNIEHSVNVQNIAEGQRLMMKLTSPVWPEDILGRIDRELAARGEAIYATTCVGCHALMDAGRLAQSGMPVELDNPTVPLAEIGTDPRQAETYARRVVSLVNIGGPESIPSYEAAEIVTGQIVDQWIAESPANAELADEVNQGRPNEFIAPLAYRARPLNGIWATAPFLHNGSVPTLAQLLAPPAARPKTFYTGSWEFDPKSVGYEHASPFPGAFLFDTRIPGNANGGHLYGTDLTAEEKAALIEYLKTL